MAATLALCAMSFLQAPAQAQKVNTDYDHHAAFSDFKTYKWIREPKLQDPFMVQRVKDAINQQLQAKGLREVSDDADLGVSANGAVKQQESLNTFYDGFGGGWGWHRGWGCTTMATTDVATYSVELWWWTYSMANPSTWFGAASRPKRSPMNRKKISQIAGSGRQDVQELSAQRLQVTAIASFLCQSPAFLYPVWGFTLTFCLTARKENH
jgi:hypothetical protein